MSELKETKSCPFCGEEILAVAIKCKHCQSDLKSNGSVATNSNHPKIEIVSKPRDEFDIIKSILKIIVYLGALYVGITFLIGLVEGLRGHKLTTNEPEKIYLSSINKHQLP